MDLGDGVALVRGDRCEAPDEAIWGDPTEGEARPQPNALLVLERDVTPEDPLPVEEALRRFRILLTGLRLVKPGGVALAAVAWRRTGDGRWQPFELETTGSARGEPWIFVEGEEHELADVLDAVIRSTHGGRGGVGDVALRDGLRPAAGVRGAVGLPARAARAARRRDRGRELHRPRAARGGAVCGGGRAQARAAPRGDRAGAGAVRDQRQAQRRLPRRGGLGLAAHARGGAGAPSARAAARRPLRLPGARPRRPGRRPAARAPGAPAGPRARGGAAATAGARAGAGSRAGAAPAGCEAPSGPRSTRSRHASTTPRSGRRRSS